MPASAGLGFKVSKFQMFQGFKVFETLEPCHSETLHFQPNVRRQATFLNRDTESVVVLAPNIKLAYLSTFEFRLQNPDTRELGIDLSLTVVQRSLPL